QSGVKMSKSLGNGLLVEELLKQAPAPVVRYALASVQYRSMLEWAPDTLDEARTTWERLSGFVTRASERVGDVPADEVAKADVPQAFAEDRKSTRLNSSHVKISYAVFCLKKKK